MAEKIPSQSVLKRFRSEWHPENKTTELLWKTTPGVGDLMYGLNAAYFRSFILQKPVNLNLHWYHSPDFLYHFEDPETIVERFEYINSFYIRDEAEVHIDHVFNSTDHALYSRRWIGYTDKKFNTPPGKKRIRDNQWLFRPEVRNRPTVNRKIVLWRETFNAQQPRRFKRTYEADEWLNIIDLIEAQDYKITEIDYRTPIREVFYHIITAEAVICYEGMWHYIANNLAKPMIVLTRDNITKLHTPNALVYFGGPPDTPFEHRFFTRLERRVNRAKELAQENQLLRLLK